MKQTDMIKHPSSIEWVVGKTILRAEHGDTFGGEQAVLLTFTDGTALAVVDICSLDGCDSGLRIKSNAE